MSKWVVSGRGIHNTYASRETAMDAAEWYAKQRLVTVYVSEARVIVTPSVEVKEVPT